MLEDLIHAGGPGLLIPAVLFALVLYAARGLFSLQGRKSQHRREFLEHWDPARVNDDLWLEVTIRHLYGTSLPAHVIRAALAHPHSSQALIELSELWTFFLYDSEKQSVRWAQKRHQTRAKRKLSRYWPAIRYFLFALGAIFSALFAAQINGINQWIFALLAATLAVCAFVSLWYDEAEKLAGLVGEDWIGRINRASVERTRMAQLVPTSKSDTCDS